MAQSITGRWRTDERKTHGMKRTGDILRVVSTGPAIFLVAILITVLFWNILPARFHINESSDYLGFYEPVARNIIQGSGITLRDSPATRYPPGHPIFLAGVFKFAELFMLPEEAVVSTVILICTGLSSLFLFILARQVWGPVPAAVSALVWTTYPLALWLTKQPNSEVSFLVFFYGSFALLWAALSRKEQPMFFYFSCGFLIGIAMLIRPIALGIGLLMGVVVWFVKRNESMRARAILVAVLLLGNVAAVLPWELWIYAKTGKIILLTTAGSPNMDDGLTFAILGSRPASGAPQDVVKLSQDIAAQPERTKSLSGVIAVLGEEMRNRPLTTVKLISLKVLRSWYGTDSRRFDYALILLQIPYLALILWGSWQAWKSGGRIRSIVISLWVVVLYFWGLTFMALSLARYMVPVIGLLFVLLPACFPMVTRRAELAAHH